MAEDGDSGPSPRVWWRSPHNDTGNTRRINLSEHTGQSAVREVAAYYGSAWHDPPGFDGLPLLLAGGESARLLVFDSSADFALMASVPLSMRTITALDTFDCRTFNFDLFSPIGNDDARGNGGGQSSDNSGSVVGSSLGFPPCAAGGESGKVVLFDPYLLGEGIPDGVVELGRDIGRGVAHRGWVRAVKFFVSDSGSPRLATGGADKLVKLWDPQSAVLLHTLDNHDNWVRALCVFPHSPRGTSSENVGVVRLCSVSDDSTMNIWDVESGQSLSRVKGFDTETAKDDSPWILAVAAYQSASGEQVLITGVPNSVSMFSGDGERLRAVPAEEGSAAPLSGSVRGIVVFHDNGGLPVACLVDQKGHCSFLDPDAGVLLRSEVFEGDGGLNGVVVLESATGSLCLVLAGDSTNKELVVLEHRSSMTKSASKRRP